MYCRQWRPCSRFHPDLERGGVDDERIRDVTVSKDLNVDSKDEVIGGVDWIAFEDFEGFSCRI